MTPALAQSNFGKLQGKINDSIEAYRKTLSIKPEYPSAYNNMGLLLHEKGDIKEAINAYKKA